MENDSKLNPSELPFLVTHWLSNFQAGDGKDDALRRIHEAASQMASAFTDLGMFGTANQPQLTARYSWQQEPNNASYNDVKRQWSRVPPNQLEIVAESAAAAAMSSPVHRPSNNLFHVVQEIRPQDGGGRRLGETIDLTQAEAKTDSSNSKVRSILHALPLLGQLKDTMSDASSRVVKYSGPKNEEISETKTLRLSVLSEFERIAKLTGEATRSFLSIREVVRAEQDEIATLKRAIENQEVTKRQAQAERGKIVLDQQATEARLPAETNGSAQEQGKFVAFARADILLQEIQNCDRVVAQIGNKLAQLVVDHKERQERLVKAEQEAHKIFLRGKHVAVRFRDPFQLQKSPSLCGTLFDSSGHSRNHVTSYLASRQFGISHLRTARQIGRPISIAAAKETRKSVIAYRLSHSITVNAHLTFPIYCLKFDKSGRYFVTGADDCLVKLFFLGAAQSGVTRTRTKAFTYGANERGAILVCTLRGHAGVICDVAVSADNALLATASDDGDVRVWGLKDGCPIAILRGHAGGANMVSWSTLTPYRLVSSGMDGLARIWDVRDAALKRYGSHIGKRLEYTLPLSESEKRTLNDESEAQRPPSEENIVNGLVMLPPLPPPEAENNAPVADPAANVALPQAPVVPNNAGDNANEAAGENNANPGAFVANDIMDEGIRLVAKLQHGDVVIQETGPGTRSRRKLVKVICVARCPIGGHFATGSDDGICRVWEDEDDERLALIDSRGKDTACRVVRRTRKLSPTSNVAPSTSKPLTTLVGHMSSITDLHYSHAGDRIVTASQKDGNARIWSFGGAPRSQSSSQGGSLRNRFLDPKQIVLRLSKISRAGNGSTPARPARRRGGSSASSSASSVTCDVAVWTSDDSKIVTSQSCPAKGDSQDIIPGSQLLLVWDSWTGNCLLAIKQAHSQQCPVVVTHPLEPSIMCSAGADGVAKVWDVETGRCLFHHRNTLDSGPVSQNNEKGKESGYLDGSFDPHGQHLLLTDDNGRITIFDCLKGSADTRQSSLPSWMGEQYFANDYYELFYNTNGYCVERGSEQPPHLAPRAARCDHSGSPWSDDISETFRLMRGPSPESEISSASERNMLRSKAQSHLPGSDDQRRAIVMTDFDPDRTVQINGSSEMVDESQSTTPRSSATQVVDNETPVRRETSSTGRSLSNNYRWRDYEDLIREEGLNDTGEADFGDEEFVPRPAVEEDEDLSDAQLSDSEFYSDDDNRSSNRRTSRARGRNNDRSRRASRRDHERTRTEDRDIDQHQPTRLSSRRVIARTNDDESEDDDDEIIDQVLSTNNAPSGPFANDYNVDGHLFKLLSLAARVNREWVSRTESLSSYKGRKVYTPQVGDSVVYIPRAHAATIREFPTLKAPWKQWPSGTRWPIVRCRVVNVRFRFPYKDYFRRRRAETQCVSVVAILTLEVTGIPELSADREFPWPKPAFIARQTRSALQVFEVSVFESGCAEYVIPEKLFLWRLKCLEDALRQRANNPCGLKVFAYYLPDNACEDAATEEYNAEITQYSGADEEVGDEHLNKSGFESLRVSWSDNIDDDLSPWEITIPDQAYSTPSPPSLTPEEKRAVADSLRTIESMEGFKEFLRPVDTRRYFDYFIRVEVPMHTGTMKERLGQDYYSSTLSVLSDIKLIRENCLKYNGPDDEIALVAMDLYTHFKEVLKGELSKAGVDADNIGKLDEDTDVVLESIHASIPTDNQGPRTRSSGVGVSSLELLPPPGGQPAPRTPRTAVRSRSSLEHSERDALGAEHHGTATRNRRTARNGSGQENGPAEVPGSSARATRSRQQQDKDHDNEAQSGGGSRASRSSRSERLSKRTRYAEDEDEDDAEVEKEYEEEANEEEEDDEEEEEEADFEEEEDDEEEEEEEVEESTTRRSRRASQQRSVLEVSPATGSPRRQSSRSRMVARHQDEVSPPMDSPRRQSSRSRMVARYQDERSDAEMRDEEEEFRIATRKKKDSRNSRRGSPRETEPAAETESPSRRHTPRARAARKYEEVDSDVDDDEEDPARQTMGSARSRRGSSRQSEPMPEPESPSRQSRRSRASATYQEVDSEGDEKDSEAEDVPSPSRSKRRSSKGGGDAKPDRKRSRTTQSEQSGHPKLSPWPKVPTRKITDVALGILEEMSNLDELQIFKIPVVEAFPTEKVAYLRKIKKPMDFRTIEEDKLHVYEEISELQDDLIQVFKNCVDYNGDEEYGRYAITLWEQLNHVFHNVCDENGVRLAANWKD